MGVFLGVYGNEYQDCMHLCNCDGHEHVMETLPGCPSRVVLTPSGAYHSSHSSFPFAFGAVAGLLAAAAC